MVFEISCKNLTFTIVRGTASRRLLWLHSQRRGYMWDIMPRRRMSFPCQPVSFLQRYLFTPLFDDTLRLFISCSSASHSR